MQDIEHRELYDIITIPLGATFTDKAVPLDAEILVVGQIPVNVTCKINDVGNKSFSLELFRTIRMKLERVYLTITSTSSDDLILFVSKGIEVATAPPAGRTLLVDSLDASYDAREVDQSNVLSNTTNINDGNTEYTGEISTAGYNKLVGWIFADRALTITINTYQATGGTRRQVDTIAVAASTGTAFEIPVVAGIMELGFGNSSGGNTTTCEKEVNLATGG